MSRLLFDTAVLVDAERAGGVIDAVLDDEDDVAIAAITVAELRVGVLLASPRVRRSRQAYVDDIVATLPVLAYDIEVADAHAALLAHVRQRGSPRGAHDLVIAATARASGREVVTADASAFADLPHVEVRSHRQ